MTGTSAIAGLHQGSRQFIHGGDRSRQAGRMAHAADNRLHGVTLEFAYTNRPDHCQALVPAAGRGGACRRPLLGIGIARSTTGVYNDKMLAAPMAYSCTGILQEAGPVSARSCPRPLADEPAGVAS